MYPKFGENDRASLRVTEREGGRERAVHGAEARSTNADWFISLLLYVGWCRAILLHFFVFICRDSIFSGIHCYKAHKCFLFMLYWGVMCFKLWQHTHAFGLNWSYLSGVCFQHQHRGKQMERMICLGKVRIRFTIQWLFFKCIWQKKDTWKKQEYSVLHDCKLKYE